MRTTHESGKLVNPDKLLEMKVCGLMRCICIKTALIIPVQKKPKSESAERLPPRGSDVSGDEGVGATGPYIYEICHQPQQGSTVIRLHGKPMH